MSVALVGDVLWLGAELTGLFQLSHFKRYRKIVDTFCQELKALGLEEIYCVVSSVQRFRFAEFVGFRTTKITVNNQLEVMRRGL